jgi:hypothetical protein
MFSLPFRNTVSYFSVGLLAASTLAFGQYPAPVQSNTTNNQQQQAANSTGGWKRVGDAQTADPNYPPYPVYPADPGAVTNGVDQNGGVQNPPPGTQTAPGYQNAPGYGQPPYQQPPGTQPYSQQQPPYQGQYPQQPAYQGQYPQQPAPYAQQPYGSYPGYGQQPQQNYPAPPPVPSSLTIPQGTYITVRVNQLLSSDRNQPGDAFSATLVDPVVVNGIVIAEPGETVGGQVSLVDKHGPGHPARLGIQLTRLTLVDGQQLYITTQLASRRGGTTPGGVEAGSVIATTGLGAAIGAAAGWGTGAAIGAGAGALAGLIGVVVTHNHASVVTPEQMLTFQLQAPVTFSTANSQAAFRYVEPGEYSQQPYANGPGPYASVAPGAYPPYYGGYAYAYPYPYYAYGYPYYWGSFGFWYGPRWYGGRYYVGRPFVGGVRAGVVVRGGVRR